MTGRFIIELLAPNAEALEKLEAVFAAAMAGRGLGEALREVAPFPAPTGTASSSE
mgnify:CR=1 FL=1